MLPAAVRPATVRPATVPRCAPAAGATTSASVSRSLANSAHFTASGSHLVGECAHAARPRRWSAAATVAPTATAALATTALAAATTTTALAAATTTAALAATATATATSAASVALAATVALAAALSTTSATLAAAAFWLVRRCRRAATGRRVARRVHSGFVGAGGRPRAWVAGGGLTGISWLRRGGIGVTRNG